MKKLASRNLVTIKINEDEYDFANKPYKKELYDELKSQNKEITFYALQDPLNKEIVFKDLCAGNHIESTKNIKNFKLLSILEHTEEVIVKINSLLEFTEHHEKQKMN